MKIPKKFQLGGTTWTVEYVTEEQEKEWGRCYFKESRIVLKNTLKGDALEATFLHELVHAMYYHQGKNSHNEKDVDTLAHLLHQYLNQQK